MDLQLINCLKGRATYKGLAELIATLVDRGSLACGDALPSSRELAEYLGTSRTTVMRSLELLSARGYIKSIKGFRSEVIAHGKNTATVSESGQIYDWQDRLTRRAKEVFTPGVQVPDLNGISFEPSSLLPEELLPSRDWCRIQRQLIGKSEAMRTLEAGGKMRSMRLAISGWLRRTRGILCDWDQVFVYSQKSNALTHLREILIGPHDIVYSDSRSVQELFRYSTPLTFKVPFDTKGPILGWLNTDQQPGQWIFLTPCHAQMGASLSEDSCREILSKTGTDANRLAIIEDGSYSDFQYCQRATSLFARDATGSVIFLNDFSVLLGPLSSLAFLVVPKNLVGLFELSRHLFDFHFPTLEHHVLTTLIDEGELERYTRRLWKMLRKRRASLIFSLKDSLRNEIDILYSAAGTRVFACFDRIAVDKILQSARLADLPVTACYLEGKSDSHGSLFSFDLLRLQETDLDRKIQRFARPLMENDAPCNFHGKSLPTVEQPTGIGYTLRESTIYGGGRNSCP